MRTPMNAMWKRRDALAISLCVAVALTVWLSRRGIPKIALATGAGSAALAAGLAVLSRRLRHARLILDTSILTVPSAVISEPESGRTARLEETVVSNLRRSGGRPGLPLGVRGRSRHATERHRDRQRTDFSDLRGRAAIHARRSSAWAFRPTAGFENLPQSRVRDRQNGDCVRLGRGAELTDDW